MRARQLLAGTFAAGLTLLAAAAPATAETEAGSSTAPAIPADAKWKPYRSAPFTTTAGQLCAFPISSEPVRDEERVAVLHTFPDGSPREEVYMGDLMVRFTNLDTGKSVEQDLSGMMFVEYGADGSYTLTTIGPVGVGFQPKDNYPTGMYTLDGYHVVFTAPGRTYREIQVDHGTEHNICTDLD